MCATRDFSGPVKMICLDIVKWNTSIQQSRPTINTHLTIEVSLEFKIDHAVEQWTRIKKRRTYVPRENIVRFV